MRNLDASVKRRDQEEGITRVLALWTCSLCHTLCSLFPALHKFVSKNRGSCEQSMTNITVVLIFLQVVRHMILLWAGWFFYTLMTRRNCMMSALTIWKTEARCKSNLAVPGFVINLDSAQPIINYDSHILEYTGIDERTCLNTRHTHDIGNSATQRISTWFQCNSCFTIDHYYYNVVLPRPDHTACVFTQFST